MTVNPKAGDRRKPDHAIERIFTDRWSPRAMSGEPLTDAELLRLFEAARWAPSSYNEQPWRFLYAKRAAAHWEAFFNLLLPANQAWCRNAGALALVVSKRTFSQNGKPNGVHVFDAGSAWQNLALQGSQMGLVVHAMAGFDWDKARPALAVPEDFSVCAMIAIGRPGSESVLPEEMRKMETPSPRKPVREFAFEGKFPAR
ncbi:MAG TPA: nitroreductase [Phycisphaerales bacterium]|nr:nitroreductase [Phycisphaerales bacterium]